jgi:hypothetical protein
MWRSRGANQSGRKERLFWAEERVLKKGFTRLHLILAISPLSRRINRLILGLLYLDGDWLLSNRRQARLKHKAPKAVEAILAVNIICSILSYVEFVYIDALLLKIHALSGIASAVLDTASVFYI